MFVSEDQLKEIVRKEVNKIIDKPFSDYKDDMYYLKLASMDLDKKEERILRLEMTLENSIERIEKLERIIKNGKPDEVTYVSHKGDDKSWYVYNRLGERSEMTIERPYTLFYKDNEEYRIYDLYIPEGLEIYHTDDDFVISFCLHTPNMMRHYYVDLVKNKVVKVEYNK